MEFVKATKSQLKARIALVGSSGSGKTYTALLVARVLAGESGRVACIDTEKKSASKYANLFSFDTLDLDTYSPETYVTAIQTAGNAGYDVLVIDSLSHAWMGKEGALEQVDKSAARSRAGNSFAAWREVTPMHNALIDAMLQAPMHIIATMRSKTEYVLEENDKGKKVPRKIGMAPVQRDGMEYEFDLVGDMDQDNTLVVTKTRCPQLARAVVKQPGADFGKTILAWLSDGTPVPPPTPRATNPEAELMAAKIDFAKSMKAWTKMDGKNPDFKGACRDVLCRACGKAVAPDTATIDEFKTGTAWVGLNQGEDFIRCMSQQGASA